MCVCACTCVHIRLYVCVRTAEVICSSLASTCCAAVWLQCRPGRSEVPQRHPAPSLPGLGQPSLGSVFPEVLPLLHRHTVVGVGGLLESVWGGMERRAEMGQGITRPSGPASTAWASSALTSGSFVLLGGPGSCLWPLLLVLSSELGEACGV